MSISSQLWRTTVNGHDFTNSSSSSLPFSPLSLNYSVPVPPNTDVSIVLSFREGLLPFKVRNSLFFITPVPLPTGPNA